jgi:hypothetical protein
MRSSGFWDWRLMNREMCGELKNPLKIGVPKPPRGFYETFINDNLQNLANNS